MAGNLLCFTSIYLFPVWSLPPCSFHWAKNDETPKSWQKCVEFGGK